MCVYIVFDFYGHILHPYKTWETKIDIDILHRVPSCIKDKTRSVFTPHISLLTKLQIWLDYVLLRMADNWQRRDIIQGVIII